MPLKLSLKQFFHRNLPKIKFYVLILIIALAVFAVLLYLDLVFEIKTIKLSGNDKQNSILGLENIQGENLILLSTEKVRQAINLNNPAFSVQEINKQYPDKLKIKLVKLEPVALLILNSGLAKLSGEGKVLQKIKFDPLKEKPRFAYPLLNFYQKLDYYQIKPGSYLTYEELLTALFLLEKTSLLGVEVESIDINGLNMIVFNLIQKQTEKSGKKIYLSAEKDKFKQSFELETLVTQFKIKAEEYKILDLRFDKPIVKF